MKKVLVFLILICFTANLFADSLSFSDILPLLGQQGFQEAEKALEKAQIGYSLSLLQQKADWSLNTTPYQGSGSIGGENPWWTHGLGASLSWSQRLPSGGGLQISAGEQLSWTTREDYSSFSQTPSLSGSFQQPLYIGGELINPDVATLQLRLGSGIALDLAEAGYLSQINQEIIGVVKNYISLLVQKRSRAWNNRELDLQLRALEQSRIKESQGQLSAADLWNEELEYHRAADAQFDFQYQILPMEQNLRRMLGLENRGLESLELDPELPLLPELPSESEILERIQTMNPGVVQALLGLESSRLAGDLRIDDKPQFSFNMALNPVPADPEGGALAEVGLGDAFGNYFKEGASLGISGSLGISIPLDTAEEQALHLQQDQRAIAEAARTAEDVKRQLLEQYQQLSLQRVILQEKRGRTEEQIEYYEERYRQAVQYLDLELTTPMDVDRADQLVVMTRNTLWQIRSEQFINTLEIMALAGVNLAEILENW